MTTENSTSHQTVRRWTSRLSTALAAVLLLIPVLFYLGGVIAVHLSTDRSAGGVRMLLRSLLNNFLLAPGGRSGGCRAARSAQSRVGYSGRGIYGSL